MTLPRMLSDDHAMESPAELSVTAPFAGVVVSIPHARQEQVGAGAPLVVLEAMKMELTLAAAADGIVAAVRCTVGEMVEEGRELVELAAEAPA
jgi:3-methylcrotonyl-CoA carboxylase alpha subunit